MDLSIKDRMRLLRLPNTVHERSKLYKVVLNTDELQRLETAQIREIAKRPRSLMLTDESGLVPRSEVRENPKAAKLFERVQRQLRSLTRKPFVYRFQRPMDLHQIQFHCAAIEAIWQKHIEPGARNNCAIRLASELRQLGLSAVETETKLLEWNQRNGIELSAEELRSVAHSAYQHRFPYRYSCKDAVLKRYCPLPDESTCHKYVVSKSPHHRTTA